MAAATPHGIPSYRFLSAVHLDETRLASNESIPEVSKYIYIYIYIYV